MSLPGRKLSLFNTEIASNIAASDLLVALIGAPKANKNITFTGVIQAGFRLLATAVVNTVHLADGSVTNAKLRDSAGLSVMGRSANSAGSPGDIVAGSDNTVLQRSSNTLSFTKVSRSSMSNSSPTSVIGRSANSSGAPADIVAGSNNRVLKRKGDTLQFAQVETDDIATEAVTAAKIKDGEVGMQKLGADILNGTQTALGNGATASGARTVAIGRNAQAVGDDNVAIGYLSSANSSIPFMVRAGSFRIRFNANSNKLEASKDNGSSWQTVTVSGW